MNIGKFFNPGFLHIVPSSPESKKLKHIASAFKNRLNWKWDDRFDAVLAEFGVGDKEKIRAILEQHFEQTWDIGAIISAPNLVRSAADQLGGVIGEQILLSTAVDNGALVYCAWWPWGNGKTISVRIAPFPDNDTHFKSHFGL